ncbi:hypothetical protein QL285_005053 [Trifolium repens]|nr:hypothetical protein QL285_005053 [Trifolium repens]
MRTLADESQHVDRLQTVNTDAIEIDQILIPANLNIFENHQRLKKSHANLNRFKKWSENQYQRKPIAHGLNYHYITSTTQIPKTHGPDSSPPPRHGWQHQTTQKQTTNTGPKQPRENKPPTWTPARPQTHHETEQHT